MTSSPSAYLLALVLVLVCFATPSTCNFYQLTQSTFGGDRVKITEGGVGLSLGLDHTTGSGFQSKNEYLFGRFDMQLKLVPGDSAGTVTTFYLSSPQNGGHDEIDFEFLGNVSGQPYTMHTNVYSKGKGDKEMQFHLWFDPTAAFHTYSVIWNPKRIVFLVDNSPIRVFVNHAGYGVPFPTNLPMRVYCSLWNADEWATQGGRVKTDWSKAPFYANYRNFNINACAPGAAGNACRSQTAPNTWQTYDLDAQGRNRLRWIQSKFRVYDYCSDRTRFPGGSSPECRDGQY